MGKEKKKGRRKKRSNQVHGDSVAGKKLEH